MIRGTKVPRPSKEELADKIAAALRLETPYVSTGSSVDSQFLDRLYRTLSGGTNPGVDTYRKTEAVLDRLGLTYDPYWDTSESAPKGGGTVTTRAFSRILTAVTGVPRCFLLNVNDAPVGERWERDHTSVYRYDTRVTGRRPLNEAGPGSLLVYYATSKSRTHPMHFIAAAEVEYISPGWRAPAWEARLTSYTTFPSPVPVTELELPGWNRQHAITEVTSQTYQQMVEAGLAVPSGLVAPPATAPIRAQASGAPAAPEEATNDPGGDTVVERVMRDHPTQVLHPSVNVPDVLPLTVPDLAESIATQYEDSGNGLRVTGLDPAPARSRNSARDKLAEVRAVELTSKALTDKGWVLTADRQKDGTGYDLEFAQGSRELHVEVKGIQGPRLAFNLTPKELWRAQHDPIWLVVAVTSVLSPTHYTLRVITRDRIVTARRTVTGYRVTL